MKIKLERKKFELGSLGINSEQWGSYWFDKRAKKITEIDIASITLVDMTKYNEPEHVRLDSEVLSIFVREPNMIPNSWYGRVIHFCGTFLFRKNEKFVTAFRSPDTQIQFGSPSQWLALDLSRPKFRVRFQAPFTSEVGPYAIIPSSLTMV